MILEVTRDVKERDLVVIKNHDQFELIKLDDIFLKKIENESVYLIGKVYAVETELPIPKAELDFFLHILI